MVPDRPTIPVPSLIVKAASPVYPGLAANEFLCLSAAQRAAIDVPGFALSDDGQMLILDRFDMVIHKPTKAYPTAAELLDFGHRHRRRDAANAGPGGW